MNAIIEEIDRLDGGKAGAHCYGLSILLGMIKSRMAAWFISYQIIIYPTTVLSSGFPVPERTQNNGRSSL